MNTILKFITQLQLEKLTQLKFKDVNGRIHKEQKIKMLSIHKYVLNLRDAFFPLNFGYVLNFLKQIVVSPILCHLYEDFVVVTILMYISKLVYTLQKFTKDTKKRHDYLN